MKNPRFPSFLFALSLSNVAAIRQYSTYILVKLDLQLQEAEKQ